MAAAGLSERFEAAQSAAFREAVNASTTRCVGRASGEIGAIPAEPESWKKYNMEYVSTYVQAIPPRLLVFQAIQALVACVHKRTACFKHMTMTVSNTLVIQSCF